MASLCITIATQAQRFKLPLALLVCLQITTGCSDPKDATRPMGVLLISIDSLRADHLGSYGYESPTRPEIPTTPHIDRLLADQGTSFDKAYSSTSWTLPSHLALLTGRPNELHGVRRLPSRLSPQVPMLQQRFQDADWETAGFWSGPNLHPWFGFGRGFDQYVDCSSHVVADPSIFALEDQDADREALSTMHTDSHEGITGPAVVAAFDEWFATIDETERFFAFAHFWDVHYDYTPPPEFDVFDPDYTGAVDGRDFDNIRIRADRPEDLQHLIALYDGELRFTDHNVERILSTLEDAGRLDNTLIVLVSDHGEAFAEHGMLGHKHSLHEEELHVPLILRFPGQIEAGKRVAEVVSLVDVAPTILDFCDLPELEGMWGRSLRVGKQALPPRVAPMELTSIIEEIDHRGGRLGRLKAIKTESGVKLFDLATDPKEARVLVDPSKGVLSQFDKIQHHWDAIDELERSLDLEQSTEALPDGLSADLSAAGYLDSAEDETKDSSE
jgi:arylsulfatase A-like enzyme